MILSLLLVGGTAILLKVAIRDRLATALEFAVGIMLTILGNPRLVVPVSGSSPLSCPSRTAERSTCTRTAIAVILCPMNKGLHDHTHPEGMPWRTLLVGLMHGMAGSAALVVLTAAALDSPLWGVAYILLFGLGSVVGVASSKQDHCFFSLELRAE